MALKSVPITCCFKALESALIETAIVVKALCWGQYPHGPLYYLRLCAVSFGRNSVYYHLQIMRHS